MTEAEEWGITEEEVEEIQRKQAVNAAIRVITHVEDAEGESLWHLIVAIEDTIETAVINYMHVQRNARIKRIVEYIKKNHPGKEWEDAFSIQDDGNLPKLPPEILNEILGHQLDEQYIVSTIQEATRKAGAKMRQHVHQLDPSCSSFPHSMLEEGELNESDEQEA